MNMEYANSDDYGNALISVVWRVKKDYPRKLVFALIEYYPTDYRLFHESDEISLSYKMNKNNKGRIYFIRKKITVADANCIFKEVSKNNQIPMLWENKENKINCSETIMFPKMSSHTITSQEYSKDVLPFIPDHWNICKLKHFIPTHEDNELKEIFSYENTVNWFNNLLYWNIYDYTSFIGSVHFLYPNPIIRNVDMNLSKNENGEEYVNIRVVPYAEKKINDLKVITAEKSELGLSNVKESVLSIHNCIPLTVPFAKFATAIFNKDNELLYYTNFGNFIRKIITDIDVFEEIRKTIVPVTNEEYMVNTYSHASRQVIGDDDNDEYEEIGERITVNTRQLRLDRNINEKFFTNNDSQRAREYVRNIIGSARECVTVIDPYFDTVACFDYLLAIKQKNARINIIMSKPGGNYKSSIDGYEEGKIPKIKEELPIELKKISEKTGKKQIYLYIMKGAEAIVHDRFLIIDDEVWLSGNSLNHLGERYSMIVKLKNPHPIIEFAQKIMNDREITDEVI